MWASILIAQRTHHFLGKVGALTLCSLYSTLLAKKCREEAMDKKRISEITQWFFVVLINCHHETRPLWLWEWGLMVFKLHILGNIRKKQPLRHMHGGRKQLCKNHLASEVSTPTASKQLNFAVSGTGTLVAEALDSCIIPKALAHPQSSLLGWDDRS